MFHDGAFIMDFEGNYEQLSELGTEVYWSLQGNIHELITSYDTNDVERTESWEDMKRKLISELKYQKEMQELGWIE